MLLPARNPLSVFPSYAFPPPAFRPSSTKALLASLAVAGLLGAGVDLGQAQETAKPARVITVEQQGAGVERRFFGRVAALETVDLSFQVGGQVIEFPVEDGEEIAEGSLVAELDLVPFELALEQAILESEQAERALDRVTQLQGTVSEATREDAETSFALSRVAVRNAENALEDATLLAPFEALVSRRLVANFTTVGGGTPVVRLHNMSELRVEADITEVLFQQAAGGTFDIFAQFPSTDELFPLEIREVIAEATDIGQSFTVSLALQPPEGITVLPGSTATMIVRQQTSDTRLRIPASAVGIAADGSTFALVFQSTNGEDTGTLSQVAITIEPDEAGFVVVTDGLSAGDEVVGAGVAQLADGQTVSRFLGFGG